MTNQLCVLEGEYKIQAHLKALKKNDSTNLNINDLIECYKSKFLNNNTNEQQSLGDEFVLVHSKDGVEVYSNLMQHLNSTYDFDATLLNTQNQNSSALMNDTRVLASSTMRTNNNTNNSNSSYVCFLINDFDQTDNNFIKLEETQAKICSFFNTISNNTLNATNANIIGNVSKRFMIFGWPVLNYCLENNMVKKFFII